MTTMTDVYDIVICSDCLIWHCNADDTGFCQCEGPACLNAEHEAIRTARAIERQPLIRASAIVPADDSEGFFSSRRCDACGTTLGGTRHDAHLITHP